MAESVAEAFRNAPQQRARRSCTSTARSTPTTAKAPPRHAPSPARPSDCRHFNDPVEDLDARTGQDDLKQATIWSSPRREDGS